MSESAETDPGDEGDEGRARVRGALGRRVVHAGKAHDGSKAAVTKLFAPRAEYPIYASALEVPGPMWEDPALIVQRFLPELDDGRFVTRTWNLFGSGSRRVKWLSDSPIVKGPGCQRAECEPPPDAIVEARRRLGLDYAKLDFVLHDGEPILLDVNRTPAVYAPESAGAWERTLDLAFGLAAFEVEHRDR